MRAGQLAKHLGAPWTTTISAVVIATAYAAIHATHRPLRDAR